MIDETRAQEVREAIHQAFGDLPPPRAGELIAHPHSRDILGETQIRLRLAGRKWQSLNREFVKWWWASFCYLSPQAYRYYLPALLMDALTPPINPTGLPSALSSLQPSFWALYYQGEDRQFLERQAVFTGPQYEAVSAYLGMVHTQYEPYRGHLAAQALRWGWNRVSTPALQNALAYYQHLRSYSFPEPADPQVAELCAEIRAAFAATPYPGDDQLCGSEQGDEPAEYALELRGVRWQLAHPELLARCYAALSFLSDPGFRYFLPAFMRSDLLDYESNANPVFNLTHGLTRRYPQWDLFNWRSYAVNRFQAFTRAERLAIVHYLEYRAAVDDYDAPSVQAALENYWRPSASPVT